MQLTAMIVTAGEEEGRCGFRLWAYAFGAMALPTAVELRRILSTGYVGAQPAGTARQHGGAEPDWDADEHLSVCVRPEVVVTCTDVGWSRFGHHAKYQPF